MSLKLYKFSLHILGWKTHFFYSIVTAQILQLNSLYVSMTNDVMNALLLMLPGQNRGPFLSLNSTVFLNVVVGL